jgi:hypothetical protein
MIIIWNEKCVLYLENISGSRETEFQMTPKASQLFEMRLNEWTEMQLKKLTNVDEKKKLK